MDDGEDEGKWTSPIPIQQPDTDRPRGSAEHLGKLMPPRNENLQWRGPKGADSLRASPYEQARQDSPSALLPGTIFAIVLALVAVGLYFWVPLLGIMVGVAAAMHAIVAAKRWLQLGQR